jgi:eukaryotic-like serine/threonine-protein kinase
MDPTALPHPSKHDPLIGLLIAGRYRILAELSRGQGVAVYRAEQEPLGRQVALRVVESAAPGTPGHAARTQLEHEAAVAVRLRHPNLVSVFDHGESDGVYYLATELLDGRTLHDVLRAQGRLAPERALHIALQICRALREAHGHGFIHRDLRPLNVLLLEHGDERDVVKVLAMGRFQDGSSHSTRSYASPRYAAPEQLAGQAVDARADIYALGAVMYEMLSGQLPPQRGRDASAPARETFSLAGLTPPVSPAVDSMVRRCLAADPEARFARIDDVLEAIKGCRGMSRAATLMHLPAITSATPLALATDTLVSGRPAQGVPHSGEAVTPYPGTLTPLATYAQAGHSEQRPLPASAPAARRRLGPSAFAAIAALCVAAGGLLAAVQHSPARGPRVTVAASELPAPTAPAALAPPIASAPVGAAAEPALAPVPTASAESAAQPAVYQVTLRSQPEGALVSVAGRALGATPIVVSFPASAHPAGTELTFHFELAGHRPVDVTRQLRTAELVIDAPPFSEAPPVERALPSRPRWRPVRNQPAGAPAAVPDLVDRKAVDLGFKPTPY